MNLTEKKCIPCEGGIAKLSSEVANQLLSQLDNWKLNEAGTEISKNYDFKNFYKTMAFVNAIAWIANQENHHPNLAIGYNYCRVSYFTHAIQGLSENDFICAAKIDKLFTL